MKKYPILALILSLVSSWAFTACDTSNETEYEASRDCIVTAVTLGTLNRPMHTTSSTGADSIYMTKVTGALYPMFIDQLDNRIYNADSLPKGTDITKIVFSHFNVAGSASIRSLSSGKDTIFSALDSTDFSVPRIITVTSEDRLSKREYTVEVRVHHEAPDTFAWQRIVKEPTANKVAAFTQSRALSLNRELFVFGNLADGTSEIIRTSLEAPAFNESSSIHTEEGQAIEVHSIQYFKNAFYALGKGSLVSSSTGIGVWSNAMGNKTHFDALVGCSTDSIFAIENGKMYASADALNWTESDIDTPDMLPVENITSVCQPSRIDKSYEIMVMTGNKNGQPCVWKRDIDRTHEFTYPWMYLPQTEELGDYPYPDLRHDNLVTYDQATLLTGLLADGTVAPFYISRDNGRIWKPGVFKHPAIKGATSLSTVVDADHYLWIFCGGTGEVYKGRLNRLGWANDQNRFE